MNLKYTFEKKRGVRRISVKNDDVNFFENSRILNFFENDQINLAEIKYEKIIRGMKINFFWIKYFWWSSNRICPISKPVWTGFNSHRPNQKIKIGKRSNKVILSVKFQKKNRQAKNLDFLKTTLTDKKLVSAGFWKNLKKKILKNFTDFSAGNFKSQKF